jgi:tetratricopeptide (TPR) repeat protein
MNNLAILLKDQGKLSEAEPLYRNALRCRRETLGETHPDTLSSMNSLGWMLTCLHGEQSEAEQLCRKALSEQRKSAVLGDTHPSTLATMDSLAHVFSEQGNFDDAELLYREVVRGLRETLGADHTDTLAATTKLSSFLTKKEAAAR